MWLTVGSCYCSQCHRQQNARWAQLKYPVWQEPAPFFCSQPSKVKYTDPSSEFVRAGAARGLQDAFTVIRSKHWSSQQYKYVYIKISLEVQPAVPNAPETAALVFAMREALLPQSWKPKASILLRIRRGHSRKILLFRGRLCTLQTGHQDSQWQGAQKGKMLSLDEDPTNVCLVEEFSFSWTNKRRPKPLFNFWKLRPTLLIDDALLFQVSFGSS